MTTQKSISADTIFNPVTFQSIHNRIAQINPDAKRQWGKMNPVQMLNHLKIATGSGLKIYNLKDESNFLYRGIIRFVVLRILKRLPKNARAPRGFQIEMSEPHDFNSEKQQVLNMLKKAYSAGSQTFPHPLFGTLSRADWGRLISRHFDHHLRQFGF